MALFYLLLQVVLLIGFIWIIVQSIRRRGKMGINVQALVNPINCPKCGQVLPRFRTPKGFSEMLWGGWTCPNCGTKFDKWGKEKI